MSPFAWALVAGTIRAGIELSDRTEVRVRGDDVTKPVVDVETVPAATLTLGAHQGYLKVGYSPHFAMMGDVAGPQSSMLHSIHVYGMWKERHVAMYFYHEGNYGRQSFASLAIAPTLPNEPMRADIVPTHGILSYAFEHSGLLTLITPTRRWTVSLNAEHTLAGGLDEASRRTLPLQHGPRGDLGLTYAFSRADKLTVSAGLERTWLLANAASPADAQPGQRVMSMDDIIFQSTAAWRHVFNRSTEATLSGGLGWATARHDGVTDVTGLHPVAETSMIHRVPSGRFDLRLMVRFSPVVDRWSGEIDERVDYTGGLQWSVTRSVAVEGSLMASQPIPPVHHEAPIFVLSSLSLSYKLNRIFQIEGGGRSMWSRWVAGDMPQANTAPLGVAPFMWVSFVAVTATAPAVMF